MNMKSTIYFLLIAAGLAMCSENSKKKQKASSVRSGSTGKSNASGGGSEMSTGSSRPSMTSQNTRSNRNTVLKDSQRASSSSSLPAVKVSGHSSPDSRNSLSRSSTDRDRSRSPSILSLHSTATERSGRSHSIQIPRYGSNNNPSVSVSQKYQDQDSIKSSRSRSNRNSISTRSPWNKDLSVSVSQRNEAPGRSRNQDPSVSVSQHRVQDASYQGGWKELQDLLRRRKREMETFDNVDDVPIAKGKNLKEVETLMDQFYKNCKLAGTDMIVDSQNHKITFELVPLNNLSDKEAFLLMYMSYQYMGPENTRRMMFHHMFLLARAEGHIVGFAKIQFSVPRPLNPDRTFIHMVYTEPEFVKYKISPRLVKMVVDTVRRFGGKEVFSVCVELKNKDEINAFESNNFEHCGQDAETVAAYQLEL